MASPQIYPNGAGGSTGALLATVAPLYMSGNVWYVSSSTGSDAASPRGKERIRPLATLAQAHTNASAGDVIVCLAGHTESISSAITFSKAGIRVIGEGSGATRPRFTRSADVFEFDVTAAGVSFWNLYFVESGVSSLNARVRSAASATSIRDCYVECGQHDDGPAIEYITGAGACEIRDTTVISVATSLAAQPDSAINFNNTMSDMWMESVTIDGGSVGWANPYAIDGAAAVTRLAAVNVDLLNDSDVTLASGTTGFFSVRNDSGSARIVWAA